MRRDLGKVTKVIRFVDEVVMKCCGWIEVVGFGCSVLAWICYLCLGEGSRIVNDFISIMWWAWVMLGVEVAYWQEIKAVKYNKYLCFKAYGRFQRRCVESEESISLWNFASSPLLRCIFFILTNGDLEWRDCKGEDIWRWWCHARAWMAVLDSFDREAF